ncbi:hypothetical protein IAQ61_005606, partial [Plenodomus lingam]|uniref:uncharacterized protein n=1 Tax=Leptosphaeria maculans TaxID=5022 RepID=UPI003319BC26
MLWIYLTVSLRKVMGLEPTDETVEPDVFTRVPGRTVLTGAAFSFRLLETQTRSSMSWPHEWHRLCSVNLMLGRCKIAPAMSSYKIVNDW